MAKEPAPEKALLSSFFRKASISFVMRFGGLALQFAGSILFARVLGLEQFGAYTFAMAWTTLFGLMLPLGLGDLSVRELPGYMARKQLGPLKGFLITAISVPLITGAILALVLSQLERYGLLVLRPGWQLVALFAVLHGLILTVSNALNGFGRILTSQFLETIARPSLYLTLVGLGVLVGFELSALHVYQIMLIAAVPILLTMAIVLGRMFVRTGALEVKPEYRLGAWFAGALPLLMTTMANRMQLQLGILMVGMILGEAESGIYRVAARGAMLITFANMIAIQLVGPMLARATAEENREKAQDLLSQAAIVSFFAGFPIALVLGLGSFYYLGLYGHDFRAGELTLRILVITQLSFVFAGPTDVLLVMLRRERIVFALTTTGVVLNVLLNLLLIPWIGLEGAAISSLLSTLSIRAFLLGYVIRKTGFDTTLRRPIRRALLSRLKGR